MLLNIVYKINIHLKSEVYIHLCQVYLNKAGRLFVENISCPMSDTVGLLFFKDVKCLSNTRENYLFQLLSTRAHANCSLAFQGSFGMVGSCLLGYVYIGGYVYCGCQDPLLLYWNLFALYTTNYVWRHVWETE